MEKRFARKMEIIYDNNKQHPTASPLVETFHQDGTNR